MSSPMPPMPPGGGMPPGGPPGGDPIAANESMMNPTDLAGMQPQMQGVQTVRQFMEKVGIDVDGPVSQLEEFGKKQLAGAKPMDKMRNIAGGGMPPGGAPPGGPPGAPPGAPPGMDNLLSGL